MKKKLNSVYLLFVVLLAAFFQLSSSSNPSNGYTGAPPSGNTCSGSQGGCHSGGGGAGMVQISGLPSTVAPNSVHSITVTVTRTNMVPQDAGFQLVVQNSNNSNAGMLSNAGAFTTIQFTGGKYYAEHSSPQGYSGNIAEFTFDWTAPATAPGPITMYVAGNLVDGNGSSGGDAVETATATTMLSGGGGGGAITVAVSGTNVSCAGGNNGSATATASGGGGDPYTYNWSNSGSGATITGLSAGTYTVTVTNAAGGSGTGSVTITQPPALNLVVSSQVNVNCNIPVGSATVQASGGVGGYSYAWPDGQTGPTASLDAGQHTATLTDANNCSTTVNVNILSNTLAPTAEAGTAGALTCTISTLMLSGAGSSSGSGIQYLWTTSDGIILSGATTLTPLVGAAGTYTLTVTNNTNGCTASDVVTVTSNTTAPTANAGVDGNITCANPTLQLNGTSSSQGPNFTYLWTTANGSIASGATTLTPTVSAAGTYCLNVTNTSNGCTSADCVIVGSNTVAPLANAGSASPLTCTTTQVTLNGSASSQGSNFSYLWTTTNGHFVSGANTLSPVVDVAAAYLLTVTNSTNGCTATSSVSVTANTTQPTASAGPNRVLNCNNTTVVLDGSGSSQGPNFTYLWTGPSITAGGNTPNPTVNAAGNYIILVTNTANGCVKTDTATVTQTPTLGAGISASQNVACNGASTGSATAAGSGGKAPYAYAWSNNANTAQINNIAAGTYTATITDADNCTATASVTITQPPALNANASATGETSVGASNGSATANPTGGTPTYSYAWSTGASTQTITGLSAGTYTVSVMDANGCTASQTVTVASFSCAGFGANMAATNPLCNGSANGTASTTVSGGAGPFSYLWSNGGTSTSISGLVAGGYTVSITDANGCIVTGNVSLVAPTALNLAVQPTNVACNGSNTGAATVNASGGTPGYTYDWSNGGMGASQNNLPAGNYTVSVTDANGCTANIQTIISQPPALVGNLTASGESGVNTNDGTASLAMSGGVAPYQYLWSNGATTSAITNLQPGNYCVSATDANGCVFTGCTAVSQFGCVGQSLQVTVVDVTCAGGNNGLAQADAAGFEAPVAYAWSNAAGESVGTGSSVGNLAAGSYTVIVTGSNGCQSVQTIEIEAPTPLSVAVLAQNNLECAGGNDGSLTVAGEGGTPNYTYTWSNGTTTPTIAGLPAGVYEVVVSDDNDCAASLSLEISVLPDTEAPTAAASNLTVSLSASGTASIAPAMLDNGSSDNCGVAATSLDALDFDCDDLGANTVTLIVTDAAGNSSTASAVVTVVDDIAPSIVCPQNITVDNGDCSPSVTYDAPTASDNCAVATLSVDGPSSGSTFPSGTTTVTWQALDASGNASNCAFTVTVVSDFVVGTAFTMPICNGDENGTATATGTGGTQPFSYAWDDPASQQTATATGLSAGNYSVSVTDAAGCIAVQTVEVTEPAPIVVTVESVTNQAGGQLGAIDVTVEGGTGGFGFEWTLFGEFVSNEEDASGLEAGIYQLQVTDQSGCVSTLEVEVLIIDATEEELLGGRIGLAPNPSSGRVFLSFDLAAEMPVTFQIFDLSGKAMNLAQSATVSSSTFELDLTGVAPGVYLLRAIVNESVVVKRLVVGR